MVFGCTDDEFCMSLDLYESEPGKKLSYRCPSAKCISGACQCGACGMDERTGVCNEIDEITGETEPPIIAPAPRVEPNVCTKQKIGGFDVCWKQETGVEVNCPSQDCGIFGNNFIRTVNGIDVYEVLDENLDENGNFIPSIKLDFTCINDKFPNFKVCMEETENNGKDIETRTYECLDKQEGGISNVLNACKSDCSNKRVGLGHVCVRESSAIVDCDPKECGIDETSFVGSQKTKGALGAMGVVNVYDPKASKQHKKAMATKFAARGVGAYRPKPKRNERFGTEIDSTVPAIVKNELLVKKVECDEKHCLMGKLTFILAVVIPALILLCLVLYLAYFKDAKKTRKMWGKRKR